MFQFKVLEEFQTFDRNKLSIDGSITILDSESFYLPQVQMSIMENGYNFWVGNYSGVSRTGKVIPSGKMTKVSVVYNNNVYICCKSKSFRETRNCI